MFVGERGVSITVISRIVRHYCATEHLTLVKPLFIKVGRPEHVPSALGSSVADSMLVLYKVHHLTLTYVMHLR